MSDWRTMQPGPDLDRVIAERLGWLIDFTGYWVDKNGNAHLQEDLPHFSTSVDAALTLWQERSVVVRPNLLHRMWVAAVLARVRLDGITWEIEPGSLVEAKTPALAICRAWLAWQERIEATHETD